MVKQPGMTIYMYPYLRFNARFNAELGLAILSTCSGTFRGKWHRLFYEPRAVPFALPVASED